MSLRSTEYVYNFPKTEPASGATEESLDYKSTRVGHNESIDKLLPPIQRGIHQFKIPLRLVGEDDHKDELYKAKKRAKIEDKESP